MEKLKLLDERKVLTKDFKIYGDFENPLFLAKDVAEWIEHSDTSMMLKNIDEDEKLLQTIFVSGQNDEKLKCLINTSGQNREMWFLTEYGLYEVLMQSRKPIAKVFKKEVKKILKEIRTTGKYDTNKNGYILNGIKAFTTIQIADDLNTTKKAIDYKIKKLGLKNGIDYIDLSTKDLLKFKAENNHHLSLKGKANLRLYNENAKNKLLLGSSNIEEVYSKDVLKFTENTEEIEIKNNQLALFSSVIDAGISSD